MVVDYPSAAWSSYHRSCSCLDEIDLASKPSPFARNKLSISLSCQAWKLLLLKAQALWSALSVQQGLSLHILMPFAPGQSRETCLVPRCDSWCSAEDIGLHFCWSSRVCRLPGKGPAPTSQADTHHCQSIFCTGRYNAILFSTPTLKS